MSNMEESKDGDVEQIIPICPIADKDNKIATLEKKLQCVKEKDLEIEKLKEALATVNVDLRNERRNLKTFERKINFTKNATEQRLLESIANPEGFVSDPLLIGVYSATLNEEDFEFDDDKEEEMVDEEEKDRSRRNTFMKAMEQKIDKENSDQRERLQIVRNQILEKVKATKLSRTRSRSNSGASRSDSKKRNLSVESEEELNQKLSVRPRPKLSENQN